MRSAVSRVLATAIAAIAGPVVTSAEEPAPIGVAAPLTGPQMPLGLQVVAGASAARSSHDLVIADDSCSAEGGKSAAERFIAARVAIVTGFLCTEAIEAALPKLSQAGIPVITSGVRTNSLTDTRAKTGWLVWRVAPRADAEGDAVDRFLTDRWRSDYFAIVDDGTIYGRELAESLRLSAEEKGLQPVLVDTYRPQMDNQIGLVGRLRRAGATAVFVGGERDDAAIIARDAAKLDIDLTVAGGEALRARGEVAFPEGVLMVAPPDWSTVADAEALSRFRDAGIEPEGYVLPSHAVTEIVVEALRQASQQGRPLPEMLAETAFQTVLGPIAFDPKGDLAADPYRLFRHDGTDFVEIEAP